LKIVTGFELAKSVLSRRAHVDEGFEEREAVVRDIIAQVRQRGDAALYEYTKKFDGVKPMSLEVKKDQTAAAYLQADSGLVSAMKLASERIRSYHTTQKNSLLHEGSRGGTGWVMRPLRRVGVYVPGGTVPLPSSLLMTVIPARVAGVGEVILVTPPQKEGGVSPLTLVAADIAGVDRVFSVGGAQAITALAFGTESIPAVDKVCGPGNVYVTLAKKLLFGVVGIDALQGPSEVMIIADQTADAECCAADLVAQAEHASGMAVLVVTSMDQANIIIKEAEKQAAALPEPGPATESLKGTGIAAVVDNIDEAIELANLYAPEHLLLMVDRASSYIEQVVNAACIVTGRRGTVALGDYIAGPSHVLPTSGTARFASPLNVLDFVKLTSIINVDDGMLKKLGPAARTIATAEGLDGHARAIERRLKVG
jgi:histidinol dehydrogenase